MWRKDNGYDNSIMETFFGWLQNKMDASRFMQETSIPFT